MKKITKKLIFRAYVELIFVKEIITMENRTHISVFYIRQMIEYSIKAIIEEYDLGFKNTNSLVKLYERIKDKLVHRLNPDQLILLDQLYIDKSYYHKLGLLKDGKPSMAKTREFYDLGKFVFETAKKTIKTG